MPQVLEENTVGVSHLLMVETYIVECDLPKDGLVARSARDYLVEINEKLGDYEDEDILVGIALTRAIANWRAMMLLGDFGDDIHQEQMKFEIQKISKFLSSQYQNKFFILGQRPKRNITEYIEKLTPHGVVI
ncbi:hypothetical protein ACFL14_01155 [Patescibacteria group bacterium]